MNVANTLMGIHAGPDNALDFMFLMVNHCHLPSLAFCAHVFVSINKRLITLVQVGLKQLIEVVIEIGGSGSRNINYNYYSYYYY